MIGYRVQQVRKSRGLSLSDLAEQAGVAKSYLSNLERDVQKNPSIHFLEKLSTVLEVPLDRLLHASDGQEDPFELDEEWIALIQEAIHLGIQKQQFREFLDYNKWKLAKAADSQ